MPTNSILSLGDWEPALPAAELVDEEPTSVEPVTDSGRLCPPLTLPLGGRPAHRNDAAVLIVSDDPVRHAPVVPWLESVGYSVTVVGSADDARVRVGRKAPAIVLWALRESALQNLGRAAELRDRCPEAALIVVSTMGSLDEGTATADSWRHGVQDVLAGTSGRGRLLEAVLRGFEWHCRMVDYRAWRETLGAETAARLARLGDALAARAIESVEDIDALLVRLTDGDRNECWHAFRVSHLAGVVAQAIGFSPDDVSTVERAGLLHDVGRLTLPPWLLQKSTPLTRGEQEIVRQHPETAHELVKPWPYLSSAAETVRAVREWFDGSGYPNGLQGDAIPMDARIVTAVEVFDTVMLSRPYRNRLDRKAAVQELTRCQGTQLDPRVVDALQGVL